MSDLTNNHVSPPYKLRRPFEINGKLLESLIVDFEDVPGRTIDAGYDEHNVRKSTNPAHTDQKLPLVLVAKANGIIFEELDAKLMGGDKLRIYGKVERFFSGLASEETSLAASSIMPTPIEQSEKPS